VEAPANPDLAGQMFLVLTNSGSGFGVISAHRPYADDPATTAESIDELRRRHLFAEHNAWLAVDIMNGESSPSTFQMMGKLMAELSGPDCLMLYSTTDQLLEPWHDELANMLRGPDPMAALCSSGNPPVIGTEADDPALLAAAAEARRRWPEFTAAFHSGDKSCERFTVKAPFVTSKDGVEWMWIEVVSMLNGKIQGAVGNDPVDVPGVQLGSPVEVDQDQIQDWLYLRKGTVVGCFTAKALGKQ
jgi:uncharacterized protein YegJ (DUF2314 family)